MKTRKSINHDYTVRLKMIVLSHYGGICAVCGVTDPVFLTIDHVNNDGNKHRVTTVMGKSFYCWLVRNDFPAGFQVLCWNHNFMKHTNLIVRSDSPRSKQDQRYRRKLKRLVIGAYGGRCKCGEANMDVLTIDHVNGGGTKHIKSIGQSRFYLWLKKCGFPVGFQVLCFNCNCGKYLRLINEPR